MKTREFAVDDQKQLVGSLLKRIIYLLEYEEIYYDALSSEKAELKSKMKEARRDMIRLEKLLYDCKYMG